MAPVILIMGPPGAGKGTQAEILAKTVGGVHLSTGQILRQSNDAAVHAVQNSGGLVSAADLIRIATPVVSAVPAGQLIVLDGAGRRLEEAEHWNRYLAECGRQIQNVIFLNIPQDEGVKRNLKRGRRDDDPADLPVRWQAYHQETEPVLDYYRKLGLLKEVDGAGTVEEVAQRIQKAVDDSK